MAAKPHLCACGETDPSEFYGKSRSCCKACTRKKRKAHYQANREAIIAWQVEYQKRPATVELRRKRHLASTPAGKCPRCGGDKPREARRHLCDECRKVTWEERNPQKVKEMKAAEAKRNAHRRRTPAARERNRRNQRARRLGRDKEAVAYAEVLTADPCSYCGSPADTVDHVVALEAGGLNAWDNLTAACRSCNSAKNARPLLVFLAKAA